MSDGTTPPSGKPLPERIDGWVDGFGYLRISDDPEGEEAGVERQEQDVRAKAKAERINLVGIYWDNDTGASTLSKKPRPDYDQMLANVKDGKAQAIVAYTNGRLTRRPLEWIELINLANSHGLIIRTAKSGQYDLTTADGRAVALTVAIWDAAEVERLSERLIRQQLQHAQSGHKHQGKHRVYGYDRDFNIIEEEAVAVREAFERKANGESLTSIAYILNQKGYRTATNIIKAGKNAGKTIGGGKWDSSLISRMIKRHDYIGEIAIKGEVVGPASFKPIVDRAVWIKANEEADKNKRRGLGARKSLLAGFLICNECGYKMKGGGAKNERRYNCPSPKATNHASCGSCSIVGSATDEIVLFAAFEKMLEKEDEVKTYTPPRNWQAEEESIRADMAKANEYRRSRQLAMEDFVPLMAELRGQLHALLKEEAEAVVVNLGDIDSWLEVQKMTLSAARAWLDQHISYVIVSKSERIGIKGFKPERLTVHFTDGEVRTLDHDYKVFVAPPRMMPVDEFDKGLRKHGFAIVEN